MALAVTFVFSFIDSKNRNAPVKVRVPNGYSIAQYVEFGESMATLLAALSSARLANASANITLDLTGSTIRAIAEATSDIFEKAVISVRSTVSGLFARFNIPTFNETYTASGSQLIDLTAPNVANLVAIYEDGYDLGGGNYLQPTDKRGNDLADVSSAREIFRQS